MSRAFVKDDDGGTGVENLPDRLVSDHPNLVTERGLAHIEAEVRRFTKEYAHAQSTGDRGELQRVARDLRYWTQRRASAELQPPPVSDGHVHFGSLVTIERSDGRSQTFRIVGEDEAEPSKGTISYVSPLARALLGKTEGATVRAGSGEAVIVDVA